MSTVGEITMVEQVGAGSARTIEHLSSEEFKGLFRQHPAGVAVVTFAGEQAPVGFTATSVISVSAAPPLLAFAIASTSSSWRALRRAETVVVNFLDAPAAHLSTQFATRDIDRFAGVDHQMLPTGEVVLTDAAAWVRARIVGRAAAGDSFLVTLHALTAQVVRSDSPLVYHDRSYHRIGPHTRL